MKKIINPYKWVSLDVETSGTLPEHALQPWSKDSWVTSFATSWSNMPRSKKLNAKSFPPAQAFSSQSPFKWQEILEDELNRFCSGHYGATIIGWNVAFDAAWLIKMGHVDFVMNTTWLDAMLMWKHLTRIPESDKSHANRKRYGLKEAVKEFLPKYAGYEEDVEFHDMSYQAVMKRLKYNRMDAALTFELAKIFWEELSDSTRRAQKRSFLIECKAIPLVASHYMTGISIDREAGVELGYIIDSEMTDLKDELAEAGATPVVMASPAKLSNLLFNQWELPSLKETDKGADSTAKDVLYELAFLDSRVKKVQRFRELKGLKTKFVDNLITSCRYNSDGQSHPTANIGSTYTGRMTFSSSILKNKAKRQTGFAIHQMKRLPEYRRIVTAPEGYTLVEWDAAGQEYRWVAIESGDPVMLDLCLPGEDAHSYMAAQISQISYDLQRRLIKEGDVTAKRMRQAGKVGNLSCQYRIGAPSLLTRARVDYELDWQLEDATQVYNTYHGTYVEVKMWWKRKISIARQRGYAETLAGRRVLLEGDWGNRDKSWQLESSAINFPIQGVGADQKYLAMACIKPLLTRYDGKFYFELHDGLYAIFPNKVAEKAALEGRKILSNLPYAKAWGFTPPIPLPWDLKMGLNWGDLKEVAIYE
jgi:DNA polymerase-1